MKLTDVQKTVLETALVDGVAISNIVETMGLPESFVLEAARQLKRPLIFESAGGPRIFHEPIAEVAVRKGTTTMQKEQFEKVLEEARARGVAAAIAEHEAQQKASLTPFEAARQRLIHEEAETMVHRANSAEERGLEHASLQELAAVAALTVPR